MYRISELAQQVGLSRSTLLYYEKIGLIKGCRMINGYRSYSDKDVQRLKLLLQLQASGLTLSECQACLEAKVDRELLLRRLKVLEQEIEQKIQAKILLSSLLGNGSMQFWHQSADAKAPNAHLQWLMTQGFSEKEALRLRWLSKDMNSHDQYMADFEALFSGLERLGPGSTEDSLRALEALTIKSGTLLEIGCGKGITANLLSHHSQFFVTALDNDEYNLSCVEEKLPETLATRRVKTVCASMTSMPFSAALFDVIWSEGSAYIMGVENALRQWRRFLKNDGYIVITDLVWLTATPADEIRDYWLHNYPDMQNVEDRVRLFEQLGYSVIEHFELGKKSWDNYLIPLENTLKETSQQQFLSNALADLRRELDMHSQYLGQYGYQCFVAKCRGKNEYKT